jgi:hypothetical protein
MAYWGEAMTFNQPVWQRTSPDLAKAALNKLAPAADARRAKAPTEKEQDWIGAVERLYGSGDKLARDLAYADAMKRMAEKYANDDEVKAFYALSLLGTSHNGRDVAIYMRAAAIAEQIYAKNPQHPGAAHYLIHCYDDPIHAPLGLRFADAYSKIAPAASHALHMPSHIYVAMGMWDESAAINERSVKAADARARREEARRGSARLPRAAVAGLLVHAAGTLRRRARHPCSQIEAAAQGERLGAHAQPSRAGARRVPDRDAQVGRGQAAGRAERPAEGRRVAEHLRDRFCGRAVRQPRRRRPGDGVDGRADGRSPVDGAPCARRDAKYVRPSRRHAEDRSQGRSRRPGVKPIAASAPSPQAPRAPQAPCRDGAAHGRRGRRPACAAGDGAAARGVASVRRGRREEALVLARQAAVVEASLPFEFGPPVPVKPANEQVGEMLMDLRRPKEAQEPLSCR